MTDLYTEILKAKSTKKTITEFIDELVEDPTVRDNFLIEFVDEIIDSMDPKDIIRAYAQQLLSDLETDCENNQEEYIINECLESFPYLLERFGVNLQEDDVII